MKQQDFSNHTKFYAPHHFVFYPVLLVLLIVALSQSISAENNKSAWWFISAGLIMIGWMSFMMRQHYSLTLQNRLVRLELRVRYHQLTGNRLEKVEEQLGFDRIAALRFAGDDELPGLLDKALAQNLTAKQIKMEIRDWTADHMRV